MALDHVEPCEVVNLSEYGKQAHENRSNALVKTDDFEAIVMNLAAGDTIPPHAVAGPVIVHCLEGSIDFPVDGNSRPMRAGDWMYLAGGARHAVEAREDARVLVTILFDKSGHTDRVDNPDHSAHSV